MVDETKRPTSLLDVVEECLGDDLQSTSPATFAKLSDSDFRNLAEKLYDHSNSEYVRYPQYEDDTVCVTPHWDSELNYSFGGAGQGMREAHANDPLAIRGRVYSALLYYDVVVFWDGLEMALDHVRMEWWLNWTSEDRARVLELLSLYAALRPLEKRGALAILPRGLWGDLRVRGGSQYSGELFEAALDDPIARRELLLQLAQRCSERTWLQLGLADVPDTWSPGAKNLRLDLLGELGFSESELSRDGDSLLRADVVLGRTETLLDDLVRAQVHFGYMPLLDTPALEIVYSTALEVAGRSFPDGKADVLLEGAEAVLPSLGCIDPIQLLSLRDSPLAGRFREQLRSLCLAATQYTGRPLAGRQAIEELLRKAANEARSEVAASSLLRQAFTEAAKIEVGMLSARFLGTLLDNAAPMGLQTAVAVEGAKAAGSLILGFLIALPAWRKSGRLALAYSSMLEATPAHLVTNA